MGVFKYLPYSTIHFSLALNTPLFNGDGLKLGKLKDFFVDYEVIYPEVLAIQYIHNKQYYYVQWSDIKLFSYKKIIIKTDAIIRKGKTYPKIFHKKILTSLLANQFTGKTVDYPPLGKVILDRQIVDTFGKKVVKVNDIHFIKVGGILRVIDAEVGLRSLIRRLGYEPIIDKIVKLTFPNAKYLTKEKLISWKFVHAIPDKSIQSNVKLNLSNEDLETFHPADLADVLEELDSHGREAIFSKLDPEMAARTLSEVEQDIQKALIKNETPEVVAKIVEHMGTDEAADLLNELNEKHAEEIISNIKDDEIQEEIHELLEYEEDTAGGLMSTEVFQIDINLTRNDVLKLIQEEHQDLESVYDIYIVDKNEHLIGTCTLFNLLKYKENVLVKDIMIKDDIKTLTPKTHWKEIASFMSKYNLINLPITDEANQLLGLISVDDVLPWLLDER